MRTISWAAALLPLIAVAAGGVASAQQEQDFAFLASATATWSDNAGRATNAPVAATALDGLIGLHVVHNSPTLYVDGQVTELQRVYLEGHLPDQTIPNGNLSLIWRPTGELFSWTVSDSLGQISTQPFDALIANDRQTVNVASTGPDLRIPLSSENHLDLSGRYADDHYGNAALNDHNYQGRGDLAHDFGASGSQIALAYEYRRIDYELNSLGTAQIETVYGQYRIAGARTYIVLEGGEDQLDQGSSPRQRTPHVLAVLQRHLTQTLLFEAGYVHRYTNAAEAFVTDSRDAFSAGGDQTVQAVALPFEQSYGYGELKRSQGRLQLALEFTVDREKFPADVTSERHASGGNLAVDYQLASRLAFNLRAGYYEQTFPDLQQNEHWLSGSVGLSRQLTSSLHLALTAMHIKGTGNVLNARFTENRAWLVLSYEPGAARLQRIYDANLPLRLYDRPVVTTPPLH
ncbi:MAG TPA: hypothetical protein VKT54_13675 [Steroidobacteraceae bacterium]|nr:hypothetical protein [Steroidobacteraceae bacterium]